MRPQEKATAKVTVEEDKAISPEGAVFYADAGVRPTNPGFGGWGFHGYTYSPIVPKKSMGPGHVAVTPHGYAPKSDGQAEVTPITYLDGFGTIPHVSNNGAEVIAAAQAMHYAARYTLKDLTIKTDSRYVITGAQDYLRRWKANNWCKSDGSQVSNLEHWRLLDNSLSNLKTNGVNVTFEWVKGHNGDQGNEMADKYATIGALAAGSGQDKNMTQFTEAAHYWKPEEESHPLITHRRMYFVTNPENIVKGEYYLGDHGKDDALIGKRMADGSYAYVQLEKPDPYIELLVAKQMKVSLSEDNIVLVRLDELFKPQTRKDLMTFGEDMFIPAGKKAHQAQNLKIVGGSDEEPISTRLNPPLIAIRAVEAVNFLKGMFLAWKEGSLQNVHQSDITSCFYEPDKKDTLKVKSDFTSASSAVAVKAKIGETPEAVLDLELIVNIDVPSRNCFKKIEKLQPKITLLVWKEGLKAYRYATVIEATGAKGIWCGFYSNYKYLL